MQSQQPPENLRVLAKRLQSALLQPLAPVESEHQPGHGARTKHQLPMFLLIAAQISRLESLRQRHRLPKCQSQSLTRNGIHSSGSISDQGHIISPDTSKSAIAGESASFLRNRLSAAEPLPQGSEFPKPGFQPQPWIVRRQRNTNLVASHCGCISLASFSPMNFHVVCPGSRSKMPAECVAHPWFPRVVQPSPASYA